MGRAHFKGPGRKPKRKKAMEGVDGNEEIEAKRVLLLIFKWAKIKWIFYRELLHLHRVNNQLSVQFRFFQWMIR